MREFVGEFTLLSRFCDLAKSFEFVLKIKKLRECRTYNDEIPELKQFILKTHSVLMNVTVSNIFRYNREGF